MSAADVRAALKAAGDREKAAFYPTFFKAGPSEQAEDGCFIGVTVPDQRKIAREHRELMLRQIASPLKDRHHECRLAALMLLVLKFERASEDERSTVAKFFIDNLDHVNNCYLVDALA